MSIRNSQFGRAVESDMDAVWWIKKDMRLRDNPAFTAAIAANGCVLPFYAFEPSIITAPESSAFHLNACREALEALRERLRRFGSDIYIATAEAIPALEALFEVYPFARIYSHEETGSEATYARDRAVKRWCRGRRIEWIEVAQNAVFRPLRDRDEREARWSAFMREPALAPCVPPRLSADIASLCARTEIPPRDAFSFRESFSARVSEERIQVVSEPLALATLRGFLTERGIGYRGGISSPNLAFTRGSRLSAHLAWGAVSSRFVYQETQRRIAMLSEAQASGDPGAARWRKSLRAFADRLHWRDHFIQRLEDEPRMEFRALHPAYRNLPAIAGDERDRRLALFCAGQTGFPLIDACMRCLNAIGFLNFRMRAMVTSFACHALRLDWRDILHPLARRFVDYEPGIHISQVQMQAGVVGINTIRVYSPDKQLREQDPELFFVRRWAPELRDVPKDLIFACSDANSFELIPDYPKPCVDFQAETTITKDLLWGLKHSDAGRDSEADVIRRHGSRTFRKNRNRPATGRTRPNPSTTRSVGDQLCLSGCEDDGREEDVVAL